MKPAPQHRDLVHENSLLQARIGKAAMRLLDYLDEDGRTQREVRALSRIVEILED